MMQTDNEINADLDNSPVADPVFVHPTAQREWGPYAAIAENERRERQIATLYELWRAAPGSDPDLLLQRFTERAVSALDAHTCSLLLRERNGNRLTVVASVGLSQDVSEAVSVLVGERIAGRVAASGQPVLLNKDPRNHPLMQQETGDPSGEISRRPEVESSLCVPLPGGDGTVLGVLCLSRFTPSTPFNNSDLRVFCLFAAQAGSFIAQKRTVEDLTRAAEETAEMERILARTAQLTAVGQFAATVAHELRNPLSSIKGAAQFLLREAGVGEGDTLADPQARAAMMRDFLSIVVDEVDGLGRLTTDLLEFASPPAPPRREAHDLAEIIGAEIAFLRPELEARGMAGIHERLQQSALPAVAWVDRSQVGQALRNLLLNAAQSCERAEVVVGLTSVAGEGSEVAGFVVSVSDSGPGVPLALREKLWEPFYTTKARGTGLGLAQVRRVVEGHGGRVGVLADPHIGGARFEMYLPVAKGGEWQRL